MSTINGTPANDTLTGTAGDDTFRLFQGGEDTVSGQGGNDVFQFGATLDSGDTIDGGAGNDVIQIAGDYATTPLTFSATSLTGVEKIQLGAGFNYDLTTDDANVAAGQTLTIDGGNLGSGNHLDFNGAAETDGNFVIVGGAAGDDITTGAGNDTFKLAAGGNDSVEAGDGKDVFIMGASLDANDSLDGGFDGGNPHNVIRLDGDYSAGLTLGAGTIQDIYTFQFAAGHSYKIVADAATFLSGPAVSIQGGNLGAGDSLTFDNSASDANLHFTGGAGNDTAIGGDAQNTFDLAAGGNDTATGGALTDHFRMGSAFTASDRIDGGGGFDVVSLDGMGTQDVIVFNATTMVNVESLQLAAGFDYSLTTDDATVASGATLIVDAHTLGAANSLTFDGSAESDGSFVLRGGAGNDTLTGGARADTFNLTAGGDDTASGGGGNDTFNLGGTFTASDAIDGGTGNDTAVLQGMGDDSIFFTASTMTNVETLVLDGGHHYDLVTADATVAAGKTLTVDASALGAGDTMDFDGSAETNGNFHIIAGAGPYELIGGGGGDEFDVGGALTAADSIDGGGGNDIVAMNGDYAGAHALVLDATTLTNITQIALFAGHSYDLTTDDATVAAGHALTINGSTLGAADSFTFDGAAETDGTFSITGGAGDNVLTGGAGADYFDIENGGNDTVHGGGGDDSVFASNELTAADTIDGGAGNDTVELQGDYTGGKALVLGATTMTNVETLQLDTGSSYDITTNDATVAAGQTLTVDASALGAGDTLTFNGAAETDGALSFLLGAHFTAADSITGGVEGYDTIYLDGDYSAGLTFGASTITDIEDIVLGAGHGYNLTTNDANVELGGTLTIDARALGAGDNLTFNGGAETNGGFIIYAGAGNDTLTGGAGFDIFNMGAHLTAADTIDGGGGGNSVYLDGDYSAGVTFGASTMTDISAIVLATGYGYNLTTNDATVAAGMTLTVEDYSTDNVTFNGSAETNGSFDIFAAEGNDTLTGGAGNDAFFMADNLTAADTIDGGAGNDTVELYGDYSAGLTLAASTITNVETLKLGDGFSYKLTTNDGNVASGATMAVDASALTGTNALTFDGSAENGGFYAITGGAGDDSVTYGSHFSASDSFDGGGGNDTLVLTNVQGNYFFADTTMHSVEDLVITPQTASVLLIVTTDANVAAGATLTVDFSNLNPGDNPSESFDGEAETDGHFAFIAPSGGTGSVVFDYTGGAQSDTLSYTHSLNVAAAVFNGMGGDDVVTTTASASTLEFNGGTGNDTLAFTGGGTENQAYYLSSVENVAFDDNNWNVVASFNLDVAGGSVNIDATALSGGHTLSFNGADVYNHGNASFVFEFGGNFGIGDTLTGGAYDDVLSLDGDYSSLYIFGSSQLTSIETIRVADGHTYDLQMGDGTVAAGATLTVDASALTGSNRIAFDGSLEQDGHFAFIGGAGPDSLVGGMQSDTFDFSLTNGADAAGFGGNDTFTFTTAANLLSVQFIDGGTGSDTLILDGDFSTQTAVTSLHFNSIEALQLLGGTNSYNLSFADGITTALAVDASAASSLTFDARGNTTTTFTITGSAGDDVVKFAGNFTVSDTFNGGAGNDTLTLDGDYSGGLTLGASMIASVEKIAVGDGFSYELVADDANVAAGATLTVDASALTGTNTLDFSGADETDGHFAFISGAGNDALEGGAQSDTFDLSLSGGAFASGNGGNDSFTVTTAAHLLSDDIIGGTGTDTLILNGDFSTQTALTGSNLNSVEALTLLGGGNSYNLTFADGITTALTVDASAASSLTFDGSGDTTTAFTITGSTGNDALTGGANDDTFIMGANLTAADTIDGGAGYDTITLDGDYTGGHALTLTALTSVEEIDVGAGHDYDITVGDIVASSETLVVDASALGAANALTFDGSAETGGHFVLDGGAGNDSLTGGQAADTFFLEAGGNDTVHGGAGDDKIDGFGTITAADTIDGGTGTDTIQLQGDYSAGLTLGATTLTSVEILKFLDGFSYNLTTVDANVAAGATLTLNAGELTGANALTFNGSAETDGSFAFTGGAGDDVLTGGAQADTFDLSKGGNDTVSGGDGNDSFSFGAAFTAADSVDGGAGNDTLELNGDYSAGVTFGATTMTNVETLRLDAGHSYNLTTNDATVASGQTLTVDASALGASDTLTLDATAETDGHFAITGGAGDDIVDFGGSLTSSDTIDGGDGYDTITLDGDYSGGHALSLAAGAITSVEEIDAEAGHDYDITTGDIVASSATLVVDASALGAANALTFDGSAETGGHFFLEGGAGDDSLTGGGSSDIFDLSQGGIDTVHGGDGDDKVNAFGTLTAADTIDGGTGTDTIQLQGDYSAGLTLGATTLTSVEILKFLDGFSYNLTTVDANVAAGGTLTLNAGELTGANALTFNGSAETDGSFAFTGGAGDDVLTGGAQADTFDLSKGGNDTVSGGDGNDSFSFGAAFTAADSVDGGAGNDTLELNGDYSAGVTFGATTMTNVETLRLDAGHSYNLTTNDATVASGQTLTVDASALGASDTLTLDATAETDGSFDIIGGAGADVLTGGAQADTFDVSRGSGGTVHGNGGNDLIVLGATIYLPAHIDGGAGTDTVEFGGDYSSYGSSVNIYLTSSTVTNIEAVKIDASTDLNQVGLSGDITGGASLLTVDASAGGAGDALSFVLNSNTTTALDITSGAGADSFSFGSNFKAADSLDGGAGYDTVSINGTYGSTITLGASTLLNIEDLRFVSTSYSVVSNDGNVAAGQTLKVDASSLTSGTLTFNGSAETDGAFDMIGGTGNDTLTGGAGADTFDLTKGGNDSVVGGAGDDTFYFGNTLTTSDYVDGVSGNDTVNLAASGTFTLNFNDGSVERVSNFVLQDTGSYNLTYATEDFSPNVTVDGSALTVGHTLTFAGTAGLAGTYDMIGGADNDTLTGSANADSFDLSHGGNDTASGGGGNDTFIMGAALTAADTINGGSGTDTVELDGDYSAGVTFGATTMTNVETLTLDAGHSYNLTTNDANVASGQTLTINASALGAGDGLTFNGAAETNGKFAITGGAGNDTLTGGAGTDSFTGGGGADTMTGGGGTDTFVYSAASDSTGTGYDTITDISFSTDRIDVPGTVTGVDTAITTGALSTATFDADLAAAVNAGTLAASHAVLFTADSGTLSGHTFLVVDENGTAGYQASADLVIDVTGYSGTLTTSSFS